MRRWERSVRVAIPDALPQGQSLSQIHRETGVDRNTIRKVQAAGSAGLRDDPPPARSRSSLLDPYHQYIRQRLAEGCWNTAVLCDEIRAQGYQGGRSILKEFVRPLRLRRDPAPVVRYEPPPGRPAQCDGSRCGRLPDPDGTEPPWWIFAYTLSYSRCRYIACVHDGRQDTLFECLEHAFAAFGGVPLAVLSDHRKPMVRDHPAAGPVWHPRFAAFAAFHGVTPQAARPYRAPTKGYEYLIVMESRVLKAA
jgi:transposase